MADLAVSTGHGVATVLAALERAGAQARPRGEVWEFFCPVHEDGTNRAGELRQGDKGALIVCHAGCDRGLLVERLGITMADLFDEKRPARTDWDNPDARYVYRKTDGTALYEVRRIGFGKAKQIRPWYKNGAGWKMGLPEGLRVPYRLPELLEAVAQGVLIYVCEGERDADAAHSLGLVATTNIGGAKKWLPEYNHHFVGARVVIIPDRDEVGYDHARLVYKHLSHVAQSVQVYEAAVGNDLCDHLASKLGIDDLLPCDLFYAEPPAAETITVIAEPAPFPEPDEDLDTFLNTDEPDFDWIIPGLVERGDRIILTGPEGGGKSTLMRQITVQAGAGIHPFTLAPMTPIRVMYVDLENSVRHVRRQFRPLRLAAENMDATNVRIRVIAQGVDLLVRADQDFLEERISVNKPDLLVMGPLYKLIGGDPTEEKPARQAITVLDRLRDVYGFALIMEAHSPHASNGGKRPERPYGASIWLRWPEFGIFIDGESGALRHWRGSRDEREWPALLQKGGDWPWTPVTDAKAVTFARMVEEVRRAGRNLTVRELATITGASKSQVQRAIDNNRNQWTALMDSLTDEEF